MSKPFYADPLDAPVEWQGVDPDGRLGPTYRGPARHAALPDLPATHRVIEVIGNPSTQYFNGTALRLRPTMPLTVDGKAIYGIPRGAFFSINGIDYDEPVADGMLEIEVDQAIDAVVSLRLFPYLDATVTIKHAEDPA